MFKELTEVEALLSIITIFIGIYPLILGVIALVSWVNFKKNLERRIEKIVEKKTKGLYLKMEKLEKKRNEDIR